MKDNECRTPRGKVQKGHGRKTSGRSERRDNSQDNEADEFRRLLLFNPRMPVLATSCPDLNFVGCQQEEVAVLKLRKQLAERLFGYD